MVETDNSELVGSWKGRSVYKLEDGNLAQERDYRYLVEMSEELVELFKEKQNQEE